MAQASMATVPVAKGPPSQNSAFTADELREVQEYDRIINFRNSIVAGSHPRIKVPAQTVARPSKIPADHNGVSTQGPDKFRQGNLQSFDANTQQPVVAMSSTAPSTTKAFGVGKTPEIDPLLLTKSDELIKAELQLQRQRLERSLRDQIDQQRRTAGGKSAQQSSEQIPDLDLSDILAKALTLVQATAPQPPVSAPAPANMAANASDSSDSFDENTFYSSQHDTPEPSLPPEAHIPPEDKSVQNTSSSLSQTAAPGHAALTVTSVAPATNETRTMPLVRNTSNGESHSGNVTSTSPGTTGQQNAGSYIPHAAVGGLLGQTARPGSNIQPQIISSNGSGATSRSGESSNSDANKLADRNGLQSSQRILVGDHLGNREPPLVRAHNLSPCAPQPAHVSPLATARQPAMSDPELSILPGAPAQVAALRRRKASNGTSPESSPQGEKGGKKEKKKNKKKRKAATERSAERAAEQPPSPSIKTEPCSPSPSAAPQFTQPNKRARRAQQQQQELNYDEPRADQPVEITREEYMPRPIREERGPVRYERVDDPYARRHSVLPPDPRLERPMYEERILERPIYDERRPESYVRRVPSPIDYAPGYGPGPAGEARPKRSATYSAVDPFFREASVYHTGGRVSTRPVADRARSRSPPLMIDTTPSAMGPPRPLPPRIVRDQYGREYYEPPPPPSASRLSVAPLGRPAEHEIFYERAPIHAPSRMPGPDTFERDGVIYRRASPVPTPRRVVTQPDYVTPDYRSYRQRDYSVQPVVTPAPGQEFISYREATEARTPQDIPREFPARSVSVRPVEHIRYEYGRVQSVRPPDTPAREYAASVHPEPRREPPMVREYSARPVEPDMARREYSVRPVERYYDQPVIREGEVAFIEHPRTVAQEVVYEDGRREVYHEDSRREVYRQDR